MPTSPFIQGATEVYVIAEASGNHAQDRARAHALVDAAAQAGAQAIKFQTFTAEEIAADGVAILHGHDAAHDAWIQGLGVHTLRELFALGGLPRAWHADLQRHAEDRGLDFLSTPFSVDAAKFLVEDIGVPYLKIASGDLTFAPLLAYADSVRIPVILSTGGATLAEIGAAVDHLFFTYCAKRLALLHCRSMYPCPPNAVQLNAIAVLAQRYPFAIPGWSDHTTSGLVPSFAVCTGARIIEKHLTLNDWQGIDAGHSLDPVQFAAMIAGIRETMVMLGTFTKTVHPGELHDRQWARRGIDGLRPTDAAREGSWQ